MVILYCHSILFLTIYTFCVIGCYYEIHRDDSIFFKYIFLGGQPASNALVSMNQLTQPGTGTVKRRKKSVGAPNPRKMFEEVTTTLIFNFTVDLSIF